MTQSDLFGISDLAKATEDGHQAATRAAQKADRAVPGWQERAVDLVVWWARYRSGDWLLEDARRFAEAQGLPAPPDKRAWGHVVQVLKAQHKIEACGYRAAVSSHGSPKVLWRWLD